LLYECHKQTKKKLNSESSSGGCWTDVFGRLSWDKPAATITGGCYTFTKGRFGHPVEDRPITPREAARFQTFPDDFEFFGSKKSICTQIGNAVPPKLAEVIGQSIMKSLVGDIDLEKNEEYEITDIKSNRITSAILVKRPDVSLLSPQKRLKKVK
jgi:DNA (cytosine-5)-methyltransferase 1